MPEPHALLLFALASVALAAVPGPSVIYIVSRSLGEGRRAGLLSAAGVGTGGLLHVVAATAGLSALIASSASAFTVVKYAGAAYLIVLGILRLRAGPEAEAVEPSPAADRRVFWQGVVVQTLNPKTALFFLAFLPQFADPARGPVAPQVALLGALFVVLALASDSTYAFLAGTARGWLRDGPRARRRLARISGGTYLSLGALAAKP